MTRSRKNSPNTATEPHVIGIDLGGNFIKCGLYDAASGRCLHREVHPTRDGEKSGGKPVFLTSIREFVAATERQCGAAQAVGVAAPGLAARHNRWIDFMPGRLAGLEKLDWSKALQRTVHCLNDAHAALMGEVWLGAARGLDDVVLITLGTGVGGAILSEGRLLQGHIGRAGHIGHFSLDVFGPPTICGTPGGLEWQIGNATVEERSAGRFRSTAELASAVAKGDEHAAQVWDRSVHYLACGVASLINILDPAAVIIGGGIATVGKLLFAPLRRKLDDVEWRPGGRKVRILPAKLGEWAGSCGAAAFALRQTPERTAAARR